jgi:hypothetical protein
MASGSLTPSPLATQYPHLSHYVASLLQIALQENLNATSMTNKETFGLSGEANSTAHPGSNQKFSSKHPLSVSSASSDVPDDDDDGQLQQPTGKGERMNSSSTSSPPSISHSEPDDEREASLRRLRLDIPGSQAGAGSSYTSVPSAQREELIRKVIELLGNEREEEVKEVVKEKLGVLGNVSGI